MKKKEKLFKTKYIIFTLLVLSFFVLIYTLWFFNYKGKVYPGVHFVNIKLTGQTVIEVKDFFTKYVEEIENRGIKFVTEDGKEIIKKKAESIDTGLNYSFISFFPEETALLAFDSSQNTNFFKFLNHFFNPQINKNIKAQIKIEKLGLNYFLENSFPELIIAPNNAYFSLKKDFLTKEDVLVINQEQIGKNINYDQAFFDLEYILTNLTTDNVIIKTISDYPSFYKKDLESLKPDAEIILKTNRELELDYLDSNNDPQIWKIRASDLVYWLEAEKNNNSQKITLNKKLIITYLEEYLSPRINKEIILPKLEIVGGKVSNWQLGENGKKLDLEQNAEKINQAFLSNEKKINLETVELKLNNSAAENEFEIKEIIGTGHSSFQGSSANRVHNIETGVKALHGLLIKPEEEFSLVKALGEIDADSGYKTELVIKGDKTIPEYGGGLCQVATTIFRTTLQSGLPITMRQNHSYRVSYYEPAGTDATIYDPWPDFRFINDTGNYILIQARIENNDLYFDFWGTQDGRQIEINDPVIYNIVKPEPTKYIESDDLKPGEKKCTEGSHNGASAYFDYKVVYPEGATTTPVVEKRFSSYYAPWQAVCLIGKEKTNEAEIENSSTIINSSSSQTEEGAITTTEE